MQSGILCGPGLPSSALPLRLLLTRPAPRTCQQLLSQGRSIRENQVVMLDSFLGESICIVCFIIEPDDHLDVQFLKNKHVIGSVNTRF
jgi:hypothetical protein